MAFVWGVPQKVRPGPPWVRSSHMGGCGRPSAQPRFELKETDTCTYLPKLGTDFYQLFLPLVNRLGFPFRTCFLFFFPFLFFYCGETHHIKHTVLTTFKCTAEGFGVHTHCATFSISRTSPRVQTESPHLLNEKRPFPPPSVPSKHPSAFCVWMTLEPDGSGSHGVCRVWLAYFS